MWDFQLPARADALHMLLQKQSGLSVNTHTIRAAYHNTGLAHTSRKELCFTFPENYLNSHIIGHFTSCLFPDWLMQAAAALFIQRFHFEIKVSAQARPAGGLEDVI